MIEIINSVFLIIIFLVPGFIFRSVEGQFVYLDKRLQWERFALGLITRSTLTYIPFSPWLYQIWTLKYYEEDPFTVALIVLTLLFIMPSILGFLVGVVRQKKWANRFLFLCGFQTFEKHQIPSAWDHLFSDIASSWIIVRLKDGELVRGFLGEHSYFSSDPEERDIYISHVLTENNNGSLAFVNNTKGVYLKGDDISTIEFIENNEAEQDAT